MILKQNIDWEKVIAIFDESGVRKSKRALILIEKNLKGREIKKESQLDLQKVV